MPEPIDTQVDEQVDQQDADGQVSDSQGGENGDSDSQSDTDSYFLTVDDRTRYKTQEEAVKGFQNAGKRIAELSAWEKEIADVYDVHDPKQIAAIVDEYIQMKEAQAKAEADAAGKGKETTATHTDVTKLSPKEQAAFEWLKKVAPDLGYVPKAELDSLKKEIEQLKSGLGNFEQEQVVAKVEAGRTQIKQLLTNAKLPTDDEFSNFIEDSMTAYIGSDKARLAIWRKGGPAVQSLLNEAFNYVKKHFGRVGTQTAISTAASYQGSKQGGSNKATIKRLPQQGATVKTGKTAQNEGTKKPSSADIHNAAWALAQKRWGDTNQE